MRLGRPLERHIDKAAVLALGVLVALSAPSAALAEPFQRDRTPLPSSVTGAPAETAASDGGGTGTIARMVVGLLIVVAVIYGLYWLLRASARSRAAKSDGGIGIVATAAVGPNRAVHLLRVGTELVLVGSAEQGVTSLRVYTPEEAVRLGLETEDGPDAVFQPPMRPLKAPAEQRGGLLEQLRRRTAR